MWFRHGCWYYTRLTATRKCHFQRERILSDFLSLTSLVNYGIASWIKPTPICQKKTFPLRHLISQCWTNCWHHLVLITSSKLLLGFSFDSVLGNLRCVNNIAFKYAHIESYILIHNNYWNICNSSLSFCRSS